jgi:glycosyltransferase involved in cell wall biosynthesis
MRAGAEGGPEGLEAGTPLVSVVIPCFEQAHFLSEAIESVLAQSWRVAEVVVVDDGSSDNTYAIAGRYPGVRRVRQANLGVARARNTGLAESQGDFLIFLDADDMLLPRAVEVGTVSLSKRSQIALIAGMSQDVGEDGRKLDSETQPLVTQDHYLRLLEDCYIWSGSSIVYRRSAVEAVGGFDEDLLAGDDYDLYLRLARDFPIYCHDAVVTQYRRHGSNTTRDPAIVLSSQLEVLRRQRPRLRSERERRAYRRGRRRTRAEHGRALAQRVVSDWREGKRKKALRDVRVLVRRAPRSASGLILGGTG